jgi:radical SAM-linked protein
LRKFEIILVAAGAIGQRRAVLVGMVDWSAALRTIYKKTFYRVFATAHGAKVLFQSRRHGSGGKRFERMVRLRVRIRFCKQDELRLIGHRDLMRCFERLFRRSGLPLGMSEGFHPKPRMTFPLPLALGIEGAKEVMEVELTELLDAEDILTRLKAQAPAGLIPLAVEILPADAKKAQARSASYQVPIPPALESGLQARIGDLLNQASCMITRAQGRAAVDLRARLEELTLCQGLLGMRLRIEREGGVGPRDVLKVLGLEELESRGAHLTRTAVELRR